MNMDDDDIKYRHDPIMMIVVKPGSRVFLGDISATVLAVLLRGSGLIQYEISWIINGDRKTAWIESSEISEIRSNQAKYQKYETMTMGFDERR